MKPNKTASQSFAGTRDTNIFRSIPTEWAKGTAQSLNLRQGTEDHQLL